MISPTLERGGESMKVDSHLAQDAVLDTQYEKAMAEFKELLIDEGLYSPPKDNEKASHEDAALLYVLFFTSLHPLFTTICRRFLRARKYNPHKALSQFSATESWRAEHSVPTLYSTFSPDEFESAKRFYPRWSGRRDKEGHPLFVFRLASIATSSMQKELQSVSSERRYQRIVALSEFMMEFTNNLCSSLPAPTPFTNSEEPQAQPRVISSATTIVDLSDVSFGQMWTLRGHLQGASTLATANYPETLRCTLIVNAPSYFPTIWNWLKVCRSSHVFPRLISCRLFLKGWFDEHTRSKIQILSSPKDPNTLSTLLTHIHKKDLPKVYGGDLDFSFEDEPAMDDDAKNLLGEMPKGPVSFDKESKKAVLLGDRELEGKGADLANADAARSETRAEKSPVEQSESQLASLEVSA
jgi:hypothetical protein